jgi:hypothetical protein
MQGGEFRYNDLLLLIQTLILAFFAAWGLADIAFRLIHFIVGAP